MIPTTIHTPTSAPEALQDAMDIAYIQARKSQNLPRKSWSEIRSKHV